MRIGVRRRVVDVENQMGELLVQRFAAGIERAQRRFGIVAQPWPIGALDSLCEGIEASPQEHDERSVVNLSTHHRIEHDAGGGAGDEGRRHRQDIDRRC